VKILQETLFNKLNVNHWQWIHRGTIKCTAIYQLQGQMQHFKITLFSVVRYINKRPNGSVLLTWFSLYIFLYQTMTKGIVTCQIFMYLLGPKWGHPLYLNKSESQTPKHCFLSTWVEIGLVVLEKNIF